jgi:aldose 1-epimerase
MVKLKNTVNAGGKQINVYRLTNAKGECVTALNLGGILQSIKVLNKNGKLTDVALGYDTAEEYLNDTCYFGALVGRYANRIGGGVFSLNGREYKLGKNNGENHLHGGFNGFNKKLWRAEIKDDKLVLKLFSPDGDEGYPGNLEAEASYSFTGDSELIIEYKAVSDKDTIVNLTNHGYFNLNGEGDISEHYFKINAAGYTPVNAQLIPTGEILPVKNTPYDLREFKQIKSGILVTGGYDHNFALSGSGYKKAAEIYSEESGIKMEVFTDKLGLQFYTANFLNGVKGKKGALYYKHYGFCLETQHYPDSPNIPHFPSPVLKAGEVYKYKTVYKFSRIDN